MKREDTAIWLSFFFLRSPQPSAPETKIRASLMKNYKLMKYFTSKFLLLVFNCLSKICIAALNLTSIFNSKCTHIFSTPYIGFETTGFIHFNYIYVLKLLSFKGTRVSSWFRHDCLYRWTKITSEPEIWGEDAETEAKAIQGDSVCAAVEAGSLGSLWQQEPIGSYS